MHKERLMNVVRALRESARPEAFSMADYAHDGEEHPCGTPACAIGHYAARGDLQGEFTIAADGIGIVGLETAGQPSFDAIAAHFGVGVRDAIRLFGEQGCGADRCVEPLTVEDAAQYIETFVRHRERYPDLDG